MAILALVVHDGSHHADNVLKLCDAMVQADPGLRFAVLCEARHQRRVEDAVGSRDVRLVVAGARKRNEDGRPAAGVAGSGVVSTYLKLRQRFKGTSWWADRAFDAAEFNSMACLVRQRRVRVHFERLISQVRAAFDELRPDVVLTVSDRNANIDLPALLVAKERGIPTMLPYISVSNAGGMIWSRRLYGPNRWTPFSLYRAVATVWLPAATQREGYLFQEPHVMVALRQLGALSGNPWCIGQGLSDVVCVDTEMTAERYRSETVPADKLRVVGSTEFDTLFRGLQGRSQLRARIVAEAGWPSSRPLVVVALPQFAEQGVFGWDDHWREIRYLVGELGHTGASVLLSLHPRMDPARYTFLESEFGVRLSSEPLRDVLPAADALVAVNSSTLIWAVLCGIRPFLLDFYGLDSSDFLKFRSIRVLGERAGLREQIMNGLHDDRDFTSDWKMLSRDRTFDGRAIERYVETVRNLGSQRRTQN